MRIGLRAECVRVYSLQSADEARSHLLMVANNEFDLTKAGQLNVTKQKPPITRGRIRHAVLARRGFLDKLFNAGVEVEK